MTSCVQSQGLSCWSLEWTALGFLTLCHSAFLAVPKAPSEFPKTNRWKLNPFMTSFESHLASLPPSSQAHQMKGEVLGPHCRGKNGVERWWQL